MIANGDEIYIRLKGCDKMDENFRDELIAEGVDYYKTLERFMGREELYQKFLVKFLADENVMQLEKYLDEKNAEEAFKCAHTIKGLCGNLGFDNLLEADVPLVEKLRAGVLEGTSELFEELKKKYDRLCEIIRKYN